MKNAHIRHYTRADRDAVRHICCETGIRGQAIDSFFSDRDLWADLIVEPYLRLEPELAYVAEMEDIIGYVIGSSAKEFGRKALRHRMRTIGQIAWNTISGAYASHPESNKFLWRLVRLSMMEEPKHPDGAAQIHMNVQEGNRNQHLWKRLLATIEDAFRQQGMKQYYAEVFSSSDRRTARLYQRLGFEIYDKKPTKFFGHHLPDDTVLMCIAKVL